MFKNLPNEIVNLILDYDNKIRYRNGKYIDRINIEDEKYDNLKDVILKTICVGENNLLKRCHFQNYFIE